MTDADILSRANAFDRDGRLTAWTPEAVSWRLAEAYRVIDLTPMRLGPKADVGFWPGIVMSWEDLIDERDKNRLLAAYGENVEWEAWVDPGTIRQLSRDRNAEITKRAERAAPDAAAHSRADEAMRWVAVYLPDRPLIADAVSLWAYCVGAKRSMREALKLRRQVVAMKAGLLPGYRRHEIMPGRNFVHQNIARRRKIGFATICESLTAARVIVREADPKLSGQLDRQNSADDE